MKKSTLSFVEGHKMLDFHCATTASDTEVTLGRDLLQYKITIIPKGYPAGEQVKVY